MVVNNKELTSYRNGREWLDTWSRELTRLQWESSFPPSVWKGVKTSWRRVVNAAHHVNTFLEYTVSEAASRTECWGKGQTQRVFCPVEVQSGLPHRQTPVWPSLSGLMVQTLLWRWPALRHFFLLEITSMLFVFIYVLQLQTWIKKKKKIDVTITPHSRNCSE